MEGIKKLSTLGRPVDLEYPSNVFILVFAFAVFLAFGIFSYIAGNSVPGSFVFGGRSFISVFLTWALCREVDPDRPLSAGLAAVGQVIIIWIIDVPSLLMSFWALLIFRVLNRTTGLKAGLMDTIMVTSISLWLGYRISWIIPGASAVVLLADAVMINPNRRHLIPGGLLAGEAIYFMVTNLAVWSGFVNYPVKLGLISGISLIFITVIYKSKNVVSTGDATDEPLSARRVQLTQAIALLVAILFPLLSGVNSFHQSATFWSVLGGSSLVHFAGFLGSVVG
ncbi:hypothetical protein K9M78_02655 [Candidatus Bipolaricaulota bacterium]|nr:hypothetical protein [Candidatus Bipolaricaulota bacterium]